MKIAEEQVDPLTLYPSDEEMDESQLSSFGDAQPQNEAVGQKKFRAAVDTNVFKVELDLEKEVVEADKSNF